MSDITLQTAENGGDKGGNAGKYTPPATQEELDRIIETRLARERSKYGDYDDLKRKASEYDRLQREQMTEVERLRAELEEERRQRTEVERESLRVRIAAEKGVPAHLLTGDTEEALYASADALLEFRGQTPEPRRGARVPGEGRQPGEGRDPQVEALEVLGF